MPAPSPIKKKANAAAATAVVPSCPWYDDEKIDTKDKEGFLDDALSTTFSELLNNVWTTPAVIVKSPALADSKIDGNKTSFSLELHFRDISTGDVTKAFLNATRTFDPALGNTEWIIHPSGPMDLQKCYELMAMQELNMRIADQAQRLQQIADLEAKNTSLDPEEKKQLEALKKTESGFEPGVITFNVEDQAGIDRKENKDREVTLKDGQTIILKDVTDKQAIALQANIECFDKVTFNGQAYEKPPAVTAHVAPTGLGP